ncbi:MAG: DUF72 domain-containing protein [Acetobacteraceae bacterium]|nr:DUF72 domain-containing protein [Acetobacteraceae bacterium]
MQRTHSIRIGIGGWDYAPWRGLFYPDGLRRAEELGYASSRLTSIEINATFYRTQKPATFRAWHDGTPEDFVFAIKASRAASQRKDTAGAKPAIEHFLGSGLAELGPKLGPILWQWPSGRRFDPDQLAGFLDLLPPDLNGLPLRHALEAEHESFSGEDALALLRQRGVARVIVDQPKAVPWAEVTANHVYLRLKGSVDEERAGYAPAALDAWAGKLQVLGEPGPRQVFAYVIAGAKHRAPAAALALIERVGRPS